MSECERETPHTRQSPDPVSPHSDSALDDARSAPPDCSATGLGSPDHPVINVVVVGCAHGELDQIYSAIANMDKTQGIHTDLCIITGDFQAARNQDDLLAMAVPPKYRQMGSFHKYYSGEQRAPVPTIFIGGNHEASALSLELWPGGWVAPNIYYMGSASVIEFAGLRIAGLSGIYKHYDYEAGYYETFPLNQRHQHSVFHVRQYDVNRLSKISGTVDVFLSHDWPVSITDYGDVNQLLRKKPFFKEDIDAGRLGNPHSMQLLRKLQPEYWFSGHMHVKFAAIVQHSDTGRQTKFLALDKCMPNRRFMQVVSMKARRPPPFVFAHDPEWLAIVKAAAPYISLSKAPGSIPSYEPSEQDLDTFRNQDLIIGPEEFTPTAPFYDPNQRPLPPIPYRNRQISAYYQRLQIADPMLPKKQAESTHNPDEIEIDF